MIVGLNPIICDLFQGSVYDGFVDVVKLKASCRWLIVRKRRGKLLIEVMHFVLSRNLNVRVRSGEEEPRVSIGVMQCKLCHKK